MAFVGDGRDAVDDHDTPPVLVRQFSTMVVPPPNFQGRPIV
jgi:hypothetical protein